MGKLWVFEASSRDGSRKLRADTESGGGVTASSVVGRTLRAGGLWLAVWLAGCASGADYRSQVVRPRSSGSGTIALCVHDRRPYVVDGSEDPEFSGRRRNGIGLAESWDTESGEPLATDMAHTVAEGLRASGYSPLVVTVLPREDPTRTQLRLASTGAEHSLHYVIHEWVCESWASASLTYDVTLYVVDASGQVLGEARQHGNENLGTAAGDPHKRAILETPLEWRRKAQALLQDGRIAYALHGVDPGGPLPQTQ